MKRNLIDMSFSSIYNIRLERKYINTNEDRISPHEKSDKFSYNISCLSEVILCVGATGLTNNKMQKHLKTLKLFYKLVISFNPNFDIIEYHLYEIKIW